MCNSIVKWLFALDRDAVLTFASLQGETAAQLRAESPAFPADMDSFVFWDDGTPRVRSQAAFFAARLLRLPWRLGYLLRFLPRVLTDAVYRYVARKRFDWFGRTESCWLPPADAMHRFLP